MLIGIICLALAAQLIQGADQCLRTNANPSRDCTDECTIKTGCRNAGKKCLCDGDCGYSCVYPRMRCSKPRARLRNGKNVFKSYRFNDTQTAVCKAGFQLSGSAVRRCRANGFWDGKQARCRKTKYKNCKDPGEKGLLLRTSSARKSYRPGAKLTYYCPHKFTLSGSSSLVCKRDGTWSASVPKCIVPKCNQAVLPAHTQVHRPRDWKNRRDYGTRFTLSCDYGYTSTERGVLVCDPPRWKLEPSSFKCFPKSCPDPGTPRNGHSKGLFRFGEKVHYTCDKCYKLKGVSYRQCQADQNWSDSLPTCEPVSCSFLQSPTNGYLTFNSQQCDSVVQYHCDYGYHMIGSSRRRCQSDGTWSGNEPTCETARTSKKRTTQPASNLRKKPSTAADTTLRPATRSTQSLTTTVAFNSSCGRPLLPQETRIRLHKGNLLLVSCKQNYVTVKTGWMRCNQKWQILRNAICLAKSCSNPGEPKKGKKHGLSYFIGDFVTFTCDTCYQLDGHSKRTCLNNGSWSYVQPKCVLKTCPAPNNTDYAKVDSISNACGAKATYTCKNVKLTMLGSGEKVCNQSGMWDGAEPKCIDPNLNIAFGKRASMSSHDKKWGGVASVAVDGKRRTNGFSHTKWEFGSWWKVDLLKEETVSTVVVVNRRDCCMKRLDDFKVSVGNNDKDGESNSECGVQPIAVAGENIIQCRKPLKGRYVFVYLEKKRWSTMALFEVEVYSKRLEE